MTDDLKKAAQEAWKNPGWSETAKEFEGGRPPVSKPRAPILDLRTEEEWLAEIQRDQELKRAQPETGPPPLDQDVVEALAGKSPVEYDRLRAEVAQKLGIRVRTLDDMVTAQRAKKPPPPPVDEPADIERLEATAGALLAEPDILAAFGRDIEAAGLVGETNNAKILYLALTSRRFDKPVSVAIKGVSAGGKSFTVESVLRFFPASAYFTRTGFSEKALYFSDESFRNRFIVLFEAVGMESDYISYVIRTLLSENRLSYELPVKTESGLEARVIEKEGPTGLITTTTAAKLHPENETRLLSLGVVDTREQTAAVMATLAGGDQRTDIDYAPWRALQELLTVGEQRVVVPFARALADLIPPVAVRLRRDFAMLLSLVRAHALLHRGTRAKDATGRIVATVADYAAVRDLVADIYADGIEATVSKTMRETVEAVAQATGAISVTGLATRLSLDKNSVHHRVRKAIARGFLLNLEDKRGKPAQIVIGDPLPGDDGILPSVAGLLECWSENGGVARAETYAPAPADENGPILGLSGTEIGAPAPQLTSRQPDGGDFRSNSPTPGSSGKRKRARRNPPALGPEGDSLDDLK
jgi:hypothetical protein